MKSLTKQEFLDKYWYLVKENPLFFSSYYKYTFTYGEENEGWYFVVSIGGDSDSIYRQSLGPTLKCFKTIEELEDMCASIEFKHKENNEYYYWDNY